MKDSFPHPPPEDFSQSGGFVLIFAILMLLGISVLGIGMVYNAHHGEMAALNYKNRLAAFCAADGVRTLLAQEVIDGKAAAYLDTSASRMIEGKVWDGIRGVTIAKLRAAMSGSPGRTVQSNYLGSNWKDVQNYGVHWEGYVIPPISGTFTFQLRCDDACEFYLSSDDSPAHLSATTLAHVESGSGNWPAAGTGISKAVALKVGARYYFEFFHKQAGGDGVGQVGWSGPSYLVERPIPDKRLLPFGSKGQKWDTTLVGGRKVKYALMEAGPLTYSLSTEGFLGGKGDTAFRAPLQQTLSLRENNAAPPDSLWIPVIYYDFHANGSNPDFERNSGMEKVVPGMVRSKGLRYETANADYFGMDSIGKPVNAAPYFSCGVPKWFTAWKPGWFKTYAYAAGPADCAESGAATDTVFSNRVVKDSLAFKRRPDLGANAYQFVRSGPSGSSAFMPVDGRGFGNGGFPHNFSFCMELHTQFENTSGISFQFIGDDDAWLYINDSLVLDLGFTHAPRTGNVNLDDLFLNYGETYHLDFFYCERQSTGSSIDIITNLPMRILRGKPKSNWKRDYGELN
jgi:fibro-slime domain-containing protein